MAKKRLRKKDFKEDHLVTIALKTSNFIQKHFTQVISGVVILVAAIGIILFTANARRNTAAEAEQQQALAMDQFMLRNYRAASTTFLTIADRYSSHKVGVVSMYFLGECYLALYRYQDAIDAYDRYLRRAGEEAPFRVAARIGKAYSHEGLTQFQAAAEELEDLADTMDPGDVRYANVLFSAGLFYEETGDVTRALGFYDKVAEIATGPLKSRVDVKMALLK
ncbi:MAG: tetratricopeptide repeat protein [Candidatus Krumholzibacteria bacterium]